MTDTLQSNVLTIAADGTIGANFTGHVSAQGVDLSAGTDTTPPDTDRVRWLRQLDGATIAAIVAYEIGNFHQFAISSYAQDLGATGVILQANGDQTGQFSVGADPGPGGLVRLQGVAGPAAATVLDSTGKSSFLQLLSAQQLQLAFGAVTASYPGASNLSNLVTIAHNLGRVPKLVLGIARDAAASAYAFCVENKPPDINAIYLQLADPFGQPAGGTTQGLWWVAIG